MNDPSIKPNNSNGLLSIEVKTPPVVAGTPSTISLIIRNPFPQEVIIYSIQAPSSAPLLPSQAISRSGEPQSIDTERTFPSRLKSLLGLFAINEVSLGPLSAKFPSQNVRNVRIDVAANAKLTIKSHFDPGDNVFISGAEGADITFENPISTVEQGLTNGKQKRTIPPLQEDLASFELTTAHWLLVKPKILDLYALITFTVGGDFRSQVVPVTLSIQPPVKSIVAGAVSGGILGWLARQLNHGGLPAEILSATSLVSLLGVIVMSMILAIVLSRQDTSKGFVTLEDFYGAFVVGAMLGYTGTKYFESSIRPTNGSG